MKYLGTNLSKNVIISLVYCVGNIHSMSIYQAIKIKFNVLFWVEVMTK